MSLSAYTALKVAFVATAAIGAAAVAMDPTVKVALIVAVPSTITGLGTLALGFLNRSTQRDMKSSIDGHFTKLLAERKQAGDDLAVKSVDLAHAEGKAEGVDSERARDK